MKSLITKLFVAIFIVSIVGCSSEQGVNSFSPQPVAIGNINQVAMVLEEDMWTSNVGDSLRWMYEGPYILMPKPEPIFNVSYCLPVAFRDYKKQIRNVVIAADLSDQSSGVTKLVRETLGEENYQEALNNPKLTYALKRDVWASGQQIFYLFGKDEEALGASIRANFGKIRKLINKSDEKLIRANAYGGGDVNREVMQEMQDSLGVTLDIPQMYRVAMNKEKTMWVRYDTDKAGFNVLVNVSDYQQGNELTTKNLIKIQKSLGRYVTTENEGSYMSIEEEHLKVYFDEATINGQYAIEARGVWKMVNDYMGGAFISYLAYDPNREKLIFVQGFLQAPGEEIQRDYFQRIEMIVRSLKY